MLPSKIPQVSAVGRDVGLVQAGIVTAPVPLLGLIEVAGIQTDAGELVGHFAGIEEIPVGQLHLEDGSLELRRIGAIAFEGVGHCHRSLRLRLLLRRRRELERAGELRTRVGIAARQVERDAELIVRRE